MPRCTAPSRSSPLCRLCSWPCGESSTRMDTSNGHLISVAKTRERKLCQCSSGRADYVVRLAACHEGQQRQSELRASRPDKDEPAGYMTAIEIPSRVSLRTPFGTAQPCNGRVSLEPTQLDFRHGIQPQWPSAPRRIKRPVAFASALRPRAVLVRVTRGHRW